MNSPRAAAVERQPVKPIVRLSRVAGTAALALLPLALWLAPESVLAQSLPGLTSRPGPGGGQTWSLSIQTLVLLTSLSFLPAGMLMMTGFTRIIIVLGLLRNALGTASSPPNQVLVGLSLFLTFFVMSPVFDKVYTDAYKPLSENKISLETAAQRAAVPVRAFMLRQTREKDLAMFAQMAKTPEMQSADDVPFAVLVPSFVTSELKTAFQIGFLIFLPFLVIDLIVASALMSLGMMMLSPSIVSMPFKLLLFVLVDGWALTMGSLAASFNG